MTKRQIIVDDGRERFVMWSTDPSLPDLLISLLDGQSIMQQVGVHLVPQGVEWPLAFDEIPLVLR